MPLEDLEEDINDDGFIDPYYSDYSCSTCVRHLSCELDPDSDECDYRENRWENRVSGVSGGDMDGLIHRYLISKNYDVTINTTLKRITIDLQELWQFGETLLLEVTREGATIDPGDPLLSLINRALAQVEDEGLNFNNILTLEYTVLADLFMHKPRLMLEATHRVVNRMKWEGYEQKNIGILIKNNIDDALIRNLSKNHIGRLVTITGVVKKRTDVESYDKVSFFRCLYPMDGQGNICNNTVQVVQDGEKTKVKPISCPNHNQSGGWKHLPEQSIRGNIMYLKIQEMNYEKQPRHIIARLRDHAIERVEVGDVIQITGIWSGHLKEKRGEYESYLESTGLDRIEFMRTATEITPERRERILSIVADENYFDNIQSDFAPNVEGHEMSKMALFLQQIHSNDIQKTGGVVNRGIIHTLFIGDPGTGKTELANYVTQIAPRCGKITGKRATIPGLTLTATNTDSDFGRTGWSIEGGAMVMHDQGTLIIDEMHQMKKEVQDCLNDPMEDMRCTGVLAGQEATFQTRTCIMAIANPKFGYFKDEDKSNLAEQFNISAPLFTRFDFIELRYADLRDEDKIDRIMNKMLEDHRANPESEHTITREDFRDIIAMARQYRVAFSCEMKEVMKDYMKGMMKRIQAQIIKAKEDAIEKPKFSLRLLNSLRRFSMACARARLSDTVTERDVEIAWNIMISWLDPMYRDDTGDYNFARFEDAYHRKQVTYDAVLNYLKELTKNGRHTFTKEDLLYFAKQYHSSYRELTDKFLDIALDRGTVQTWGRKYRLNEL